MAEKILERPSDEMYKEDQCKYAIVVDRRRALPEIRDGLKPVQRRILYAALDQGMIGEKKREKTSSLAGELMKNYHPHGSAGISIATLVSWFKTKIPLMWGKGNWGNVAGDGAAADRYTECALSEFGYDIMLSELSQSPNVVNWLDTYKRNGKKEPEYLPVRAPVLLINGTSGIGVGLAVDIPSHNLGEVIDATVKLIHNPNSKVVLVPDLCQPCEIIDTDWKKISDTGNGTYKARGIIVTEQDKKGNYTLRIVSLPDSVTTNGVYEKILKLIEDKQLPMIADIFNSTKDKMPNIVIKLKTGVDPEYVKQVLYAKTDILKSLKVNFEAVAANGIDVERFSYKKYLLTFIEQRMLVKFRLYCNILQKASTRHHYLDAFIKVLESGQIDKIIAMIKKSKGEDQVIIEWIIKHCGTDEIQAGYIIHAQLNHLSMRNLQKYKDERKELEKNISLWTAVITDDGTMIRNEIEQELLEIKKKYNTPRICKVISEAEGNNIPAGVFKIVITEKNLIRKIPDVDKINIIRKDNPKFILKVDNTENLLIFDNKGKVFNLPISKIPITDKSGAGMDIRILVKNLTSDIVGVFYEPTIKHIAEKGSKHHFIVLSEQNLVKRIDIEDFLNVSSSGLIYTKIRPDDIVKSIYLSPQNLDVVICSNSKALRCKVKDIPVLKRAAQGVKAMDTNDPIEGMSVIYPDSDFIVALTKNGKMNRFDIGLMRNMSRARKGTNVIKLDSSDQIFGIYAVNDKDKIHIITSDGTLDVNVSDIKVTSNIAKGQKVTTNKVVIVKADVIR